MLKPIHKRYLILGLLVIITLVGVALRISYIDKTDLWADETFTGLTVRQDWSEMFATIIQDTAHPPLYYIILKLWTFIFGTSPFGLRSFSVFFGSLLIPLMFYFFYRVNGNRKSAIAAAGITSISPFFISYSVEARSYSLLAVIGVISMLSFYLALKGERKPKTLYKNHWGQIWLVSVVLMVLTHYLSLLLIAAYLLIASALWLSRTYPKFVKQVSTHKYELLLGVTTLTILAINLFNLTSFKLISRPSAYTWLPNVNLEMIPRFIYSFLFGLDRQYLGYPPVNEIHIPLSPIDLGMLILAVLLICAAIHFTRKNLLHKYILILLSVQIGLVFMAGYLGVNFLLERYLILAGIPLVLLIAYYVGHLSLVNISLAATAYLLLICRVDQKFTYIPFQAIADYILEYPAADKVIFTNPFSYQAARYYLGEKSGNIYTLQRDRRDIHTWAQIVDSQVISEIEEFTELPQVDILISSPSELPKRYEWKLVEKFSDDIGAYTLREMQ